MKLLLAAPFSGLPFDPIALGVHASRLHFVMKLIFAAPTSGFPFFPTALLAHVSCPAAEPIANAITNATYINTFILLSFLERACALMIYPAIAASCAYYSITSSAMASRPGGNINPSAVAVLRLITNSNFVGCWTDKSSGLVPLRILPAKIPIWRYPSGTLFP